MKDRILFVLIIIFSISFIALNLYAVDTFARRINTSVNTRTYNSENQSIVTESAYHYSTSVPALIDSIIVTTTTIINAEPTVVITKSILEHSFLVSNNETKVIYNLSPIPSTGYTGHYEYLFNSNGNPKEVIIQNPYAGDSLHIYYHYLRENQPDSMYIKTVIPGLTTIYSYTMEYDEQNRLISSVQKGFGTQWNNYRKAILTYSTNPIQYSHPLDFDNYRFYGLIGGGFETSNPLFDKYNASETIQLYSWNNSAWQTYLGSSYEVDAVDNLVTLTNNGSDYTGSFYFDLNGRYNGKYVHDFANGYDTHYSISWIDDVSNDDHIASPINQILTTYPNPFRNELNINLQSKSSIASEISIYNIKGQLIRTWKNSNDINWNGKDMSDKAVSSGIYLVKAKQGNNVSSKKIIKLN